MADKLLVVSEREAAMLLGEIERLRAERDALVFLGCCSLMILQDEGWDARRLAVLMTNMRETQPPPPEELVIAVREAAGLT